MMITSSTVHVYSEITMLTTALIMVHMKSDQIVKSRSSDFGVLQVKVTGHKSINNGLTLDHENLVIVSGSRVCLDLRFENLFADCCP